MALCGAIESVQPAHSVANTFPAIIQRCSPCLGTRVATSAHLEVYTAAQNLEAVRVCSPTPESCEEYADEMNNVVNAIVEAVDNPGETCRGADIISVRRTLSLLSSNLIGSDLVHTLA